MRSLTGAREPWRNTLPGAIMWSSSSPAGTSRKFPGAEDKLGTQMRAVGEVMSIGKHYKEAFQKSIRSMEKGRYGLGFAKDFNQKIPRRTDGSSCRTFQREAVHYVRGLRKGAAVDVLHKKTFIKHWFIEQMKELVDLEGEILKFKGKNSPTNCSLRPKKTVSPTAISPRSWLSGKKRSANGGLPWD